MQACLPTWSSPAIARSSRNSGSSRSSCWCRICTRSSRRWPAAPRRESASSRSTSAAPPWSGRRRRTTPGSRSSPARRCTRRWRRPQLPAASRWPSAAGSRPGAKRTLPPTTLRSPPGSRPPTRPARAARAYAHTAAYDAAVASWFASAYAPDEVAAETGWPEVIGALWTRKDVLRYGENPHQRAALYLRGRADVRATEAASLAGPGGVATAEQLQGKGMSYNNYVDAEAGWRAAFDFAEPCVAIMKHSNPCGIAIGGGLADAHRRAHACDPVSAYGGIIAVNGTVTAELAAQIAEIFTEVLIAPSFEAAALDILARRKNLRVLRCAPHPQVL